MFDNIAQLEKEIQEFQTNILASKELLQCLNDLTEAVKHERETLGRSMTNLQASVEQHTSDNTSKVSASVDSLLEGHKQAADKLAAEIHTAVAGLQQKNDDDFSRLQTAVTATADESTERLRNVSQKYIEKVSNSVDLLLEGHKQAADKLAAEIHTAVADLQQKNDNGFSRLQTAVTAASAASTENLWDVSQKYSELLTKLDSSKLEHIYEYCSKLERSINQKFTILGAGVILTAVLALISIIL